MSIFLTNGVAAEPATYLPPVRQLLTLEQVKERLERDLLSDATLTEKQLAMAILVNVKTLKNDRGPKGAHRYPAAFRYAGGSWQYVREEVVAWMAHWEMLTRSTRVHRCR